MNDNPFDSDWLMGIGMALLIGLGVTACSIVLAKDRDRLQRYEVIGVTTQLNPNTQLPQGCTEWAINNVAICQTGE